MRTFAMHVPCPNRCAVPLSLIPLSLIHLLFPFCFSYRVRLLQIPVHRRPAAAVEGLD
jgi:hypothetical protein